jgi:hypothetical protein
MRNLGTATRLGGNEEPIGNESPFRPSPQVSPCICL